VLEPAVGRLTGADSGPGRLPEPAEIFAVAVRLLTGAVTGADRDLAGRRVVVSAGGTREEIDPVRFIGNWSTGIQGYALARAAVARGAEVTVVAANVALPDPAGAKLIRVVSAREMQDAVNAAASQGAVADAVVMAAAVADYRPQARSAVKLKKDGQPAEPLRLTENPDILADLGARRDREGRGPRVLVGFAAETDTSAQAARAKLARKKCDLLVVNPVGHGLGFGTPDNEAVVYGADGTVTEIPRGPKEALAEMVWDLVVVTLNQSDAEQIGNPTLNSPQSRLNSPQSPGARGELTWHVGFLLLSR
jgi:phosphopantothenoylcysteine decarboxylase/phosphopantothenate--cysteine ligase